MNAVTEKIKTEFPLTSLGKDVSAGLLSGVIILIFCISAPALIFAGELAPYLDYGIGIVLTSTIIVTLILAILSSYPLTLAGPQDTSLAILSLIGISISAQFVDQGMQDQLFPTMFSAIVLTAVIVGFILFLIGILHLGNLVRFIPYTVMGGFLAGTGWLIVIGSWPVMTEQIFTFGQLTTIFNKEVLIQLLPAVSFAVILLVGVRSYDKPLLLPVFVFLGIAVFYLVTFLSGISFQEAQDMDLFLGPFAHGSFWIMPDFSKISQVNWEVILNQTGNMTALLVLTPIALLLNAGGIEIDTKNEINLDHELKYTGIANMTAAMVGGGLVSYHEPTTSVLNYRLGAKTRITGIVTALLCLIVLVFGAHIIAALPKFIFAGVLLYLGLDLIITWLYESKFKFSNVDYMIIWIIFAVIVSMGLLHGIVLGTVVAAIIFVIKYSRINVVKKCLDGSSVHSNVERDDVTQSMLMKEGKSILILQLHGFLFFGNAINLFHQIVARLEDQEQIKLRYVLMDFLDVRGLDSSSALSFIRIYEHAKQENVRCVFSNMSEEISEYLHQHLDFEDPDEGCLEFEDLDHSIEWCENEIIETEVDQDSSKYSLANRLAATIASKTDIEELMEYLEPLEVEKGYVLFEQGESSDSMYFLESGMVEVVIVDEMGFKTRLRTMGAGTIVGEMGLYLDQDRSATVLTTESSKLYKLTDTALSNMQQSAPQVASNLHKYIINQLAGRLIYANVQIQGLLHP